MSEQIESAATLSVRIWRGKAEGRFHDYVVPLRANQTILDVVTEVQRLHEPTLAYRFACRVGVCGSCAMTVNRRPRWTCRTHVRTVVEEGSITIEPLRNMERIKDLVCDLAPFIETWRRAGAPFRGSATRYQPPSQIDPASPARKAADAAIECINCGVCYSSCDVVAWNRDYVGPAGLNRAWTLINDERHVGRRETLDKASGAGGCGSCHSHANCTRHCPVGLSPSEGIAGLKRAAVFGLPKVG